MVRLQAPPGPALLGPSIPLVQLVPPPRSLMAPAPPEASPRPKGAAEGRGAGAPGAKQRAVQSAAPRVGPSAPLTTTGRAAATARGCQSPRRMTERLRGPAGMWRMMWRRGWPRPSRCGLGEHSKDRAVGLCAVGTQARHRQSTWSQDQEPPTPPATHLPAGRPRHSATHTR